MLIKELGMMFATETSKRKTRYGLYKCSCGNEFKTTMGGIKSGNALSCGCYNTQQRINTNIKHNLCHHPMYRIWTNMIQRTSNHKNTHYPYYGERGIKVCERWLKFENFYEDMFTLWSNCLTIDRINNDGNYEKSNCRWVTRTIQSRNTRVIQSNNTSGYRGVSFDKTRNKWKSVIKLNDRLKNIGRFTTSLEAAKAYDKYVIENGLEHTINGV
jgi:hypothetical protein